MASLFQHLRGSAQSIPKYQLLQNHPVAVAVVTALSAPILYLAHTDYRAWLRLGRGGLPNNALGWLIQLLLTPLRAPRLDTSCYSNPKIVARSGPAGTKSYLSSEDVPQRPGPRPTIHPWILPHRQADSWASAEWKTVSCLFHLTLLCHSNSLCHFTHSLSVTPPLFLSHTLYPEIRHHIVPREKANVPQRVSKFLHILASNSPSQLVAGTSVLERGGPALLIQPQVEKHAGARGTRNEIAHVHPLDGSVHASLAPRDAKLVIERGWGERFGLSGTALPVTYIMVYAPRAGEREAAEAEIVERIITAGMKFMLGEQ